MDTDLPNSLGAFIRDLESETKTKHDTAKWLDEQMQPRKRARTEKPTATPALESVPLPTTQANSIPAAEPSVKTESKPDVKLEIKPTETKPESKPKPKPKPSDQKPTDAKPTEAPKLDVKTEAKTEAA